MHRSALLFLTLQVSVTSWFPRALICIFLLLLLPVQVRLTEELASSAARISQLQLEVSSQQQKAAELQAKLGAALQDGERHCARLAALESQVEGERGWGTG